MQGWGFGLGWAFWCRLGVFVESVRVLVQGWGFFVARVRVLVQGWGLWCRGEVWGQECGFWSRGGGLGVW